MIRQTESSEEKESRLAKQHEDKELKERMSLQTKEKKRLAKLRAYMRDRRKNESSQEREKRLAKKISSNRKLVNEPSRNIKQKRT